MESTLKRAVVDAWNTLVDRREENLPGWERMAAQGEGISDSSVVAIVSNTMIMDVCADYAHSEE